MHRVEEISLLKAEVEALAAERDEAMQVLRQQLDREQHANAATVGMLRNDVSAANREIADLRQQLADASEQIVGLEGAYDLQVDAKMREYDARRTAEVRADRSQQALAECEAALESAREDYRLAVSRYDKDMDDANAARGRAEAAAGRMREALEMAAACIDPENQPPQWDPADEPLAAVMEALASDAGEKAATVIAAAVEHSKWCGPGGQDIERTLMQRETRNRLRAAVGAMEGKDG